MKIEGLDEIQRKLKDMSNKAKELDGAHSVSLSEVLTPAFISRHTRFSDADELFDAGGFSFESQDEFEAIPEDKLDAFIQSESLFTSWRDMLETASKEWTAEKLG